MNNFSVATNARDDKMCVYSTTDYDQFTKIIGNRKVNMGNVSKIMQSMKKAHLKVPAIINGKGEVCDGQHRLRACKELKVPFYFIIIENYELKEVQEINANQRNWTDTDFLASFVERNASDTSLFLNYVSLADVIEDNDISLAPAMTIIYNGSTSLTVRDNFRAGNLPDFSISEVVDVIDDLTSIQKYLPKKAKTRGFVTIYMSLKEMENYDLSRFLDMLGRHHAFVNELEDAGTVKNMISLVGKIYNNDGEVRKNRAIYTDELGFSVRDAKDIKWA